jgi:hypothetical protein
MIGWAGEEGQHTRENYRGDPTDRPADAVPVDATREKLTDSEQAPLMLRQFVEGWR